MSGSEGVWVVRDADDTLVGVGLSRSEAIDNADFGCDDSVERDMRTGSNGPSHGYTLQRLPLATPAMVAVVDAAITYRRTMRHEIGDDWGYAQDDAYDALLAAIDAARAAGGNHE